MRFGPGRSLIAFWKRLRTLPDCACSDDEAEVSRVLNTILNGHGAPSSDLGIDGDFYVDVDNELLYGPKGNVGGSNPGEWVFAGSPLLLRGQIDDIPDPVDGVLAKATDSTVRTGAYVYLSTDGHIEFRAAGQSPATEGGARFSSAGASAYARNGADGDNLGIFQTSYINSIDAIRFGSDVSSNQGKAFTSTRLTATQICLIEAGAAGTVAFCSVYAPGWFPNAPNARFAFANPNLIVGPISVVNKVALAADPLNGGLGYVFIEDVATVRGGAIRSSGFGLSSRVADHHPIVTIGATDHDLLSEGTFSKVVTTGALGDLNTDGIRTIKIASASNATVSGLKAPTSASTSKHITLILEPPSDTTYTLSNDAGDEADENGILLNKSGSVAGADVVVANPSILRLQLAYDQDSQRWKPIEVMP